MVFIIQVSESVVSDLDELYKRNADASEGAECSLAYLDRTFVLSMIIIVAHDCIAA